MQLLYADLVRPHLGAQSEAVSGTDQYDGRPSLDISICLQVKMITFCCEANGNAFKHSLRLYINESIQQYNKELEVVTLMETGLHILLLLICCLETLLSWLVPVGEDDSVHDMHVVNTVSPSLPEVTDDKLSFLLQVICSYWWIVGRIYRRLVLSLSHSTTFIDEGVVAHVQGD